MADHGRSRKVQKIDQKRSYNIMETKVSKEALAAFRHKAFSIPSHTKKEDKEKGKV